MMEERDDSKKHFSLDKLIEDSSGKKKKKKKKLEKQKKQKDEDDFKVRICSCKLVGGKTYLTYGINVKSSNPASRDTFLIVLRWGEARVVLNSLARKLQPWNHHDLAVDKPFIHTTGLYIDIFSPHNIIASMQLA